MGTEVNACHPSVATSHFPEVMGEREQSMRERERESRRDELNVLALVIGLYCDITTTMISYSTAFRDRMYSKQTNDRFTAILYYHW